MVHFWVTFFGISELVSDVEKNETRSGATRSADLTADLKAVC